MADSACNLCGTRKATKSVKIGTDEELICDDCYKCVIPTETVETVDSMYPNIESKTVDEKPYTPPMIHSDDLYSMLGLPKEDSVFSNVPTTMVTDKPDNSLQAPVLPTLLAVPALPAVPVMTLTGAATSSTSSTSSTYSAPAPAIAAAGAPQCYWCKQSPATSSIEFPETMIPTCDGCNTNFNSISINFEKSLVEFNKKPKCTMCGFLASEQIKIATDQSGTSHLTIDVCYKCKEIC